MDIFISWHGKRSHSVAVALRDWLPLIVNAFKPWLSSADIDKGARWRTELAAKLGSVTAGIFCLTPSNLTASWLIYEAGAISRTPEKTYVCTLLVGLQPSDVKDPLAQFQATRATKEDIHQLVKNLNKALGEQSMDEVLVNRAFEKWWPDLENELKKLPPDEAAPPPQRSERELLEELLEKVRDISQTLQPIGPVPELPNFTNLRELMGRPAQDLSRPIPTPSETKRAWRAVTQPTALDNTEIARRFFGEPATIVTEPKEESIKADPVHPEETKPPKRRP